MKTDKDIWLDSLKDKGLDFDVKPGPTFKKLEKIKDKIILDDKLELRLKKIERDILVIKRFLRMLNNKRQPQQFQPTEPDENKDQQE